MRVFAGLRRPNKLRCRQAIELITDYLEGALPSPERARLEAHLRACDGCRAYLEQMRATISALAHARPPAPDPAGREQLIELYRHHHTR